MSGQRKTVEKLWRKFFSDPSRWWDHRSEKLNARYPDFKHKKTKEALWLHGKFNPPWVEAELATIAPGTVQSNNFALNIKLARYVKAGQYEKAMELFQQMQREGNNPDTYSFVQVLNACAGLRALEMGRRIHTMIIQSGSESSIFVGSSLVDMYAKCGCIEDARRMFNKMPTRNVVSWNTMILGHSKCGQGQKALELAKQMRREGIKANRTTFVAVLNACALVASLEEGRLVHEHIIQSGCDSDDFVCSSLVDMYSKCGSIEDARRVFNRMPSHDVVSWNSMILGHVKCGRGKKALELYEQMQQEGVEPNPITFVGLLNACACEAAIEEGKLVHEHIIQYGNASDGFVANSLIDMYAKCGSIEDAQRVFNEMPVRNVVSWNTMAMGLVKCGQGQKALDLFRQMVLEGLEPDSLTFVGLLNACTSQGALEEGRIIHEHINRSGLESDLFVVTSLVDMYAKCGSIEDAWLAFSQMPRRNVTSWNSIIQGYSTCGQGQKALELFRQMHREGVEPDHVTFLVLLNACVSMAALEEGRHIHEQIISSGWESDVFVGSCLVDMYAKCGSIGDAQRVFNKMPTRNVVSWNAMLGGFAMHGNVEKALGQFELMCQQGVKMDKVTFVSLLSACSHAGLVDEGLHYLESMSAAFNVSSGVDHYACIVDLLGRTGRLHEAEDRIRMMSCKPNISVWVALLGSCRVHGNLEIGERLAKCVLEVDPENEAAYVLLAQTYAAAGHSNSIMECEGRG